MVSAACTPMSDSISFFSNSRSLLSSSISPGLNKSRTSVLRSVFVFESAPLSLSNNPIFD